MSGDTYPVRDLLRAEGARWDGDAKAWKIGPKKLAGAQRIVDTQSQKEREAEDARQAACAERERAEAEAKRAKEVAAELAKARVLEMMLGATEWRWFESKEVSGVGGFSARVTVRIGDGPWVDVTKHCTYESHQISRRVATHRTRVPVLRGCVVHVHYYVNRAYTEEIRAE